MYKEYIVMLKSKQYNQEFTKYLNSKNIEHKYLEGVNFYTLKTLAINYEEMKSLEYINLISENLKLKVKFEANDIPALNNKYQDIDYKNWGIKKIKAPCMWNRGFTGKNIKVALMDTGVNPHNDIKLAGSISFIPGVGPEDTNGHGTKMAGIIAARNFKEKVVGVAWECELYNVKSFLGESGDTGILSIIQGFDWCFKNDMDVICLCLTLLPPEGTPFPIEVRDFLIEAMKSLRNKGIIVCASTGNQGKDSINYPAATSDKASNVLPIGAVDQEDKRAIFSNYGPNIFAVAPGVDIYTTSYTGGYTLSTGTSPATAMTAGYVAILLNAYQPITINEIKQIIVDNAQGFGTDIDLGALGYDLEYGYGRICSPLQAYSILLQSEKTKYLCGEEVQINIQLLNKEGFEINSNINTKATLITPSKKVINSEIETDAKGKKVIKINSSCTQSDTSISEIGTYIVNVVGDEGECTPRTTYSTSFELLPKLLEQKYSKENKIQKIENTPISKNNIVAILNTNKGSYKLNERGFIKIETKDEDGKIISNVDITVTITYPNGYVKKINNKLGLNGKLCIPFVTSSCNNYRNYNCLYFFSYGEYNIELTSSKVNYETNTTSIFIDVNSTDPPKEKDFIKVTEIEKLKFDLKNSQGNNVNDYILNQYRNWGINKIKAPCLWDKGIIGTGIKVAMLDSGLYPHRDIKSNAILSFIPGVSAIDEMGHGTEVAGILCAKNFDDKIVGVAWDCELYSLKVATEKGVYFKGFIKAINWCIKNKMDVVNMSLGFFELEDHEKKIMTEAIIKLGKNGIIAVAATGNEGEDTLVYPAIIKPVIAVGATDKNDEVTSYSNYGVGINYVAPGEYIYTTTLYNRYKEVRGTSFSTPFISGLIALMLSEDYIQTQEEIELRLNRNVKDLGTQGYDLEYGYGRVNAPLDNINIIISPSSKIFNCNQSGNITFVVIDTKGENVRDIKINAKIITPENHTYNYSLSTLCGGVAVLDITTNCSEKETNTNFNKLGIYKIEASFEVDSCYPEVAYKSEFSIFI